MAFLDSSTAVIDAILTRKGRELLAKNDGSFKISKFAFGDDEINYQLYDANASDPDADVNNLPLLEPVSNESVALLYRLISLPKGSLKIATLTLSPSKATSDFSDTVTLTVSTNNGEDLQGWTAVSRDSDISKLNNSKAEPEDGIGTFQILTGVNAGSKSGLVKIDVTGINTGARAEFELTVSASAS
jgi:hypothetical protein